MDLTVVSSICVARHVCRAGMQANVTLYWFALPKWFMDIGGFEKEENIQEFVEWSRLAFKHFGASLSKLASASSLLFV